MNLRLAYNPIGNRTLQMTYRLALTVNEGGGAMDADNLARAMAPCVRLAHRVGAQGDNTLAGARGAKRIGAGSLPALLVSFYYLGPFLKSQAKFAYRDWALDSGAFSAHNSGKAIDLAEFTDKAKELLASDPTLSEVFALDVIGDWRASLRNTERMWSSGVPAIPCWHAGEPEDLLMGLARDYPKIAVGGCVGFDVARKNEVARQVFARVWPKRIHGFGYGGERSIMAFPWHSVDATNWEIGPCKYGNWRRFGRMSVRGSRQNLTGEIQHYLGVESRARVKWSETWRKSGLEPEFDLRLAAAGRRQEEAFSGGDML